MTRIELSQHVFDDFDRFFDHLAEFDSGNARQRIADILQAINILAASPMMGRPERNGKRELVIGRGSRGYVALYRYVAATDTVFVLALRHQRESGYKHST